MIPASSEEYTSFVINAIAIANKGGTRDHHVA